MATALNQAGEKTQLYYKLKSLSRFINLCCLILAILFLFQLKKS